MLFTALQIATMIGGRIEGNPDAKVDRVAKIEEAEDGCICFLANPKYEEYLYATKASVVIVNETLELQQQISTTLIRVKDAYKSFADLLVKYNEILAQGGKKGVEDPSYISKSAILGKDIYIGAFSYIAENVKIGDHVRIYPGSYVGDNVVIGAYSIIHPGVKIYADCKLGDRVVLHSGVVIGGDGFGFAPQENGTYNKIPQIGDVILEDDVEIGANTTVDRATMGSTIIRKGVKLDNLIMIGHNAELGENTVIAAQTGVSGSTKLGKNCLIGGQVGIVGHIQLANGTRINAQSGLSKTVSTPNQTLNGSPAFDYKTSLKSQAIFRNLPDLQQRLSQLEEQVNLLTSILNHSNQPVHK